MPGTENPMSLENETGEYLVIDKVAGSRTIISGPDACLDLHGVYPIASFVFIREV